MLPWRALLMIVTRIQQLLSAKCMLRTTLGPFICTNPFIFRKNFETDSFEKTLMLGKIEGRKRRG